MTNKNNFFVVIYGERVNETGLPIKDAIELARKKSTELDGTVFVKNSKGDIAVDQDGVPCVFY